VTMEYPPGGLSGAPFSVMPDDVEALFRGDGVERLAHVDVRPSYPHLAEQGLASLWESVWHIELKRSGDA